MSAPDLSYAVASVRSGLVLERSNDDDGATLEELAATLPEIFGTLEAECLGRVATRLGVESGGELLAEVLLLSDSRVHVIQPLAQRPGAALLAVSPTGASVGLVLSRVHAQVSALEAAK